MIKKGKHYLIAENCNLEVPRVNNDIRDIMSKSVHAVDLNLQTIKKSIVTGMSPLVQMAES